ncbi:hypothetical protein ACF07V_27565 [Streptomyces sp. NPDC015661]|uniref:hypothetical protein n=1 Tax=Streptomyces sp. NPDC015661 TaxID=3364961 RepID=UPI0036FA8B5A
MTTQPNDTWELRGGAAYTFPANDNGYLTRPLILVGDAGTEPDALIGSADHGSYSLLAETKARGLDLVLVALAADSTMTGAGGTVENAVKRAIAEVLGSEPLVVGGTGHGALAARYALASLEHRAEDHRTGLHFTHNGAAPAFEDEAELSRLNGPRIPRRLRLLDSGASDGLADDWADDEIRGEDGQTGPLLSKEYGSWLLDRLPQ